MSFEFNPSDEDPHGECRHEIERLTAENAELRRIAIEVRGYLDPQSPRQMRIRAAIASVLFGFNNQPQE